MSDPVVPPTPVETPAPEPVSLRDLSETQYNEWLKSGDLPEPKSAEIPSEQREQAPEQPVADAPLADTPKDSEPTKPAKAAKPRDDINARLGQLAEQRRLATERAEKAERELTELRAKQTAPQPTVETPKAPMHVELVKKYQGEPDWPKLADYVEAGFDDPYASMLAAQAAYIGEKQFTERTSAESERTIREKAESNVDRTFQGLREEFPDADPSVLRDLPGQSAPIFAQLLFESPLSVKLLNYFSRHPAEARTLAAMEPLAAAHALGMVESQLSISAPSRVATPTKTVSSAPEPPQTLGSRHTPNAGDELEQALASGDTGRYIELANQREVASMKAGRR